jgi:pimeloyl-ACP methyl ester carboxylesterase
VLTVDMKGFGRAPKPDDGRYAPADQAELVLRLVRERDLARITLVGHSLGGGVALYLALGLRDAGEARRLERLVLIAGAAYRQVLPPFVALARHPRISATALRVLGPEFVIAQALRAIVFDSSGITRDQVRGYAAPLHDPASLVGLFDSARQILPPDLERITPRYADIDVPTLLLWGRQDRVVPLWVGRRLAGVLPRSTLHVLERCGHMPAEERTVQSLAALQAFLEANPRCR